MALCSFFACCCCALVLFLPLMACVCLSSLEGFNVSFFISDDFDELYRLFDCRWSIVLWLSASGYALVWSLSIGVGYLPGV